MTRRPQAESLLPFLDLLCCGMGGVMVLFMILVALKGRIEFGPPTVQAPAEQDQSPFAVVAVAVGPAPLFAPAKPGGTGPFRIEGDTAAEGKGTARQSWGERHALFLATHPPAPGARLRLGPISPRAEAEIQVFQHGQRWLVERIPGRLAPDRDGMLSLWPPTAGTERASSAPGPHGTEGPP